MVHSSSGLGDDGEIQGEVHGSTFMVPRLNTEKVPGSTFTVHG